MRLKIHCTTAAFGLTVLLTVAGCSRSTPGNATLAYWNRLIECSGMRSAVQGDARSRAIADLRVRAAAIERLPASGVDLEATRIGLTGAALLREQASLADQGGDLPAAAFVDGFVWGLTGAGNPLQSAYAYSNTTSSWAARYQTWCDEAQRVRVSLTHRYGTEFPNLIRDASAATAPGTGPSQQTSWWQKRNWLQKTLMILIVSAMALRFLAGFAAQSK